MGRGRAKAKQQKVARELKYNSHYTDLDALQRELSGSTEPAEGAEEAEEVVSPRDPATYATALLLMLLVALLASWNPAARAIHIDPARTLREQ